MVFAKAYPMPFANSRSIRLSDKETLEWSSSAPNVKPGSAKDLERLAHWLDSVFEIPGIRLRFGIDALLGLLPGVGDTASALASIYILQAATKFGVSRITIARMTVNIIVDLLVGAFPIVGDIFDVYWKANRQERRIAPPPSQSESDNRAKVEKERRSVCRGNDRLDWRDSDRQCHRGVFHPGVGCSVAITARRLMIFPGTANHWPVTDRCRISMPE